MGMTEMEVIAKSRKPHYARLKIALGLGEQMRRSDWIFDAKTFMTWPDFVQTKGPLIIGNLPGFMAHIAGAFEIQPMVAGVALLQTNMLRAALDDWRHIPVHVPPTTRWHVNNISYRVGNVETFGWNAVCEYFSLGMWDARRIFSGYGLPGQATLESTLAFLERFIVHRT